MPLRSHPIQFLVKRSWVTEAIRLIGLYSILIWAIKLLTLTLITYFTISPTSRFQDISDAFSSNEVGLMGLSAALFVSVQFWFRPLTSIKAEELITVDAFKSQFLPGFAKGIFLAGGLVIAFILNGTYRFLGYFIQLHEAPLELVNILLRTLALAALAYFEAYIFYFQIPRLIQQKFSDFTVACLIALAYIAIKLLQFDLGIMQLLSLFLVSIALYYRTDNQQKEKKIGGFAQGAGFWAAILIVFQPFFSLPLFGNQFAGILLIKYQSYGSTYLPDAQHSHESLNSMMRMLSGGVGGPLSSFAFQLLLILDICRSILNRKRTRFGKTLQLMKGLKDATYTDSSNYSH